MRITCHSDMTKGTPKRAPGIQEHLDRRRSIRAITGEVGVEPDDSETSIEQQSATDDHPGRGADTGDHNGLVGNTGSQAPGR